MTTRHQALGRLCRVDSYEFPDPLRPPAKRNLRHHTEYQYMPKLEKKPEAMLTPEETRRLAEKFCGPQLTADEARNLAGKFSA